MLTIITATYRDPSGLARTRKSLEMLHSLPIQWEWIVVDSSSSESLSALEGAKNLVHLEQDPKGIYAAQNAGLNHAKGDLVWFLNGGDTLKNAENLASVIILLEREPHCEFAIAGADLFREGKFQYRQYPQSGILPMLGINRVCHQAVIYRRSLFLELGNFSEDLRIAADYELHLKAFARGVRSVSTPAVIVEYDMGGQSSQWENACEEFERVHKSLADKGLLPLKQVHAAALAFERKRIFLYKKIGVTRAGDLLRKIRNSYRQFLP